MPSSARDATMTGLTAVVRLGSGGQHVHPVPACAAARPAASCDRPALCSHTNSTVGFARAPCFRGRMRRGLWCSRTQCLAGDLDGVPG